MTCRLSIALVLAAAVCVTRRFLLSRPALAATKPWRPSSTRPRTTSSTYTRDFVGIVAEESYRQEVRAAPDRDLRGFAVEATASSAI